MSHPLNENKNINKPIFKNIFLKPGKKIIFYCSAVIVMTILVGYSYYWNTDNILKEKLNLALAEARSNWNKDDSFRRWATLHGGVYVKPSERTPRSPALSHLPDRDVVTTGGMELTLMNPAYMLRQMTEEFEEIYGTKGKITGKKQLNPINKPDEWQLKALNLFESGKTSEIVEQQRMNGQHYLRYMKPIYMTEGCVKCHGILGYKEGDLRGGVSVSVPLGAYFAAAKNSNKSILVTHLIIWLTGLAVIVIFGRIIRKNFVRLNHSMAGLEKSERQYRAVVDGQSELICRNLPDSTITFVNEAYCRYFNKDRNELLGTKFLDLLPESDRNDIHEYFSQFTPDNSISVVVYKHVTTDGSIHWQEWRHQATFDDSDHIIEFQGVGHDVTERVKAEERFRKIFYSSPYALLVVAEDGKLSMVNECAEKLFGYQRGQLEAESLKILIPERFREVHKEHRERFQKADEQRTMGESMMSLRGLRKDGTEFPVDIDLNPITMDEKKVTLCSIKDVTAQQQIERKLQEDQKRLRDILNSLPAHVCLLSTDGKLLDINDAPLQMAALNREEVIDKPYAQSYWFTHSPGAQAKVESALALARKGESIRYDETIKAGEGNFIDIGMTVDPLYDTDGEIVQIIVSGTDITKRKRAEKILQLEKHILDMINSNHYLMHTLDALNKGLEEILPGSHCSILLLSDDGKHLYHASAPSLHEVYTQAINGIPIGPNAGSCGTASFLNEQVIVSDIMNDSLWADYRELAQEHGLKACWSTPIRGKSPNKVLGTFAIYYREPKSPDDETFELIDRMSNMASTALVSDMESVSLKKAEAKILKQVERLQTLSGLALSLAGDSTKIFDLIVKMVSTMFSADYVHIVEPHAGKLRFIGAYHRGGKIDYDDIPYQASTCNMVISSRNISIYHHVTEMFPDATLMKDVQASTYWGVPVFDKDKNVLAVMALVFSDYRECTNEDMEVLRIACQRVAMEIERNRYETLRSFSDDQLRKSESKLRALAADISIAEERERRRIAIELHDNIIQDLGLCKIKLGGLKDKVTTNDAKLLLQDIREIISESISESRSLVFELSLPILYDLGLVAAIKWLAEEKSEKLNFNCVVEDDGLPKPITIERQEFLYKAVRELLINIGKHANANKVTIYINRAKSEINISVKDDGAGFNPEKIEFYAAGRSKFGLFGIKERMSLLQGSVIIESSPGQGTCIILTAPLEPNI